jgi:hypothetical protein
MRIASLVRIALLSVVLAGQAYAPSRSLPPHPAISNKGKTGEKETETKGRSISREAEPRIKGGVGPTVGDRAVRVRTVGVPSRGRALTKLDPAESKAKQQQELARKKAPSNPFVFCALPTGDAFENIYGRSFSAAKESLSKKVQQEAQLLPTSRSLISNGFGRKELVEAIARNQGSRPFILICHTEGSRENRDIPLGDGPGARISEEDVRDLCILQNSELFLVTCMSRDLAISRDITDRQAIAIVNAALARLPTELGATVGESTDSSIAAATVTAATTSVGQFKDALISAAQKILNPLEELRISSGVSRKEIVFISAPPLAGWNSSSQMPRELEEFLRMRKTNLGRWMAETKWSCNGGYYRAVGMPLEWQLRVLGKLLDSEEENLPEKTKQLLCLQTDMLGDNDGIDPWQDSGVMIWLLESVASDADGIEAQIIVLESIRHAYGGLTGSEKTLLQAFEHVMNVQSNRELVRKLLEKWRTGVTAVTAEALSPKQ